MPFYVIAVNFSLRATTLQCFYNKPFIIIKWLCYHFFFHAFLNLAPEYLNENGRYIQTIIICYRCFIIRAANPAFSSADSRSFRWFALAVLSSSQAGAQGFLLQSLHPRSYSTSHSRLPYAMVSEVQRLNEITCCCLLRHLPNGSAQDPWHAFWTLFQNNYKLNN